MQSLASIVPLFLDLSVNKIAFFVEVTHIAFIHVRPSPLHTSRQVDAGQQEKCGTSRVNVKLPAHTAEFQNPSYDNISSFWYVASPQEHDHGKLFDALMREITPDTVAVSKFPVWVELGRVPRARTETSSVRILEPGVVIGTWERRDAMSMGSTGRFDLTMAKIRYSAVSVSGMSCYAFKFADC